jgi:hypothetical protein
MTVFYSQISSSPKLEGQVFVFTPSAAGQPRHWFLFLRLLQFTVEIFESSSTREPIEREREREK